MAAAAAAGQGSFLAAAEAAQLQAQQAQALQQQAQARQLLQQQQSAADALRDYLEGRQELPPAYTPIPVVPEGDSDGEESPRQRLKEGAQQGPLDPVDKEARAAPAPAIAA